MPIEDVDLPTLTLLLSPERLGALQALTGNVRTAIELHQETLRLGAMMMNVIASIEIALRNAICENLGQHFGRPGWLLMPPPPFQWHESERRKIADALDSARRSEYAKLLPDEKQALDTPAFPQGRPANLSHMARVRARREHIPVSDGKIIAELTFYIWKRLCGPDYEHSLWRPTLKRVFPDKKVKRSAVADHLEDLYQARNRLAHHEPVLHGRFADTVAAIHFVSQHLDSDPPGPHAPLARLIAEDTAELAARAESLHGRLRSFRTGSPGGTSPG